MHASELTGSSVALAVAEEAIRAHADDPAALLDLPAHLGGWGGYHKLGTPFFARTQGESTRRRVAWIVRGKGKVTIRAGGARVGQVETHVEVG